MNFRNLQEIMVFITPPPNKTTKKHQDFPSSSKGFDQAEPGARKYLIQRKVWDINIAGCAVAAYNGRTVVS